MKATEGRYQRVPLWLAGLRHRRPKSYCASFLPLGRGEGQSDYQAIVNSGVSRLRPVAMAASTTAIGMTPLLFDPFYVAMAVTIICGLLFATGLTMIIVPTLYALFYRVQKQGAA